MPKNKKLQLTAEQIATMSDAEFEKITPEQVMDMNEELQGAYALRQEKHEAHQDKKVGLSMRDEVYSEVALERLNASVAEARRFILRAEEGTALAVKEIEKAVTGKDSEGIDLVERAIEKILTLVEQASQLIANVQQGMGNITITLNSGSDINFLHATLEKNVEAVFKEITEKSLSIKQQISFIHDKERQSLMTVQNANALVDLPKLTEPLSRNSARVLTDITSPALFAESARRVEREQALARLSEAREAFQRIFK